MPHAAFTSGSFGAERPRPSDTIHCGGHAPQALPPVASKHLSAAWDLASDAARLARAGPVRGVRFGRLGRVQDERIDLLVADSDAASWIGAIEGSLDLDTRYGLSVCLRLLALVHLLVRHEWAARLALSSREGIRLDTSLLRAAAETELTAEAQFDEQALLSRLQTRGRTLGQTYAQAGVKPGA